MQKAITLSTRSDFVLMQRHWQYLGKTYSYMVWMHRSDISIFLTHVKVLICKLLGYQEIIATKYSAAIIIIRGQKIEKKKRLQQDNMKE